MNKLRGKVAVVTGASKCIGASIAEHLAAEGASVVVNYSSSRSSADTVVARIRGRAKQVGSSLDVVQGQFEKERLCGVPSSALVLYFCVIRRVVLDGVVEDCGIGSEAGT